MASTTKRTRSGTTINNDVKVKKAKQSRLPNTMIMDNRAVPALYKFVKGKSGELKNLVEPPLQAVGMLPIMDDLREKGYTLYADDNGLLNPSYSLNSLANPLVPESDLIHMTWLGGPCGPISLHKKGGLIKKDLVEAFKKFDEHMTRDECDCEDTDACNCEPDTEYSDLLHESLEAFYQANE